MTCSITRHTIRVGGEGGYRFATQNDIPCSSCHNWFYWSCISRNSSWVGSIRIRRLHKGRGRSDPWRSLQALLQTRIQVEFATGKWMKIYVCRLTISIQNYVCSQHQVQSSVLIQDKKVSDWLLFFWPENPRLGAFAQEVM